VGKPKLNPKVTTAVMLKAGLRPLEPYTAVHAKWKCLHIECGQIVYPKYISIKRGQGGCKACGFKKGSAKRKIDEKKLLEALSKAKLKPLEDYKNKDTRWKCECLRCNRIVYTRYSHLRDGVGGCAYCSKRKVDEADAVKIMLKAKLQPLEPYKGNKPRWKCKCLRCNKTVFPSYNAIQRGQSGCKYCAGKVVSQAQAKKLFLKAKLIPLEPYKTSNAKWKSQCLNCNQIVYPTYGNVYMGHSGCVYCSEIGFKPQQSAILYLITHPQLNAIKVGITNTKTIISRLDQFKRHGWLIHKKYSFKKGITAAEIEDKVMYWLKKELKLRNYLSSKDMPITGGHTETFNADAISVLEIQKRIEKLIKGHGK
jgi:hypothetical protein